MACSDDKRSQRISRKVGGSQVFCALSTLLNRNIGLVTVDSFVVKVILYLSLEEYIISSR